MSGKRLGKHHQSPSQKPAIVENIPTEMIRLKAFLVDIFMIAMPIAYLVIYVIMGGGKGFEAQMLLGWGLILALHAPITLLLWWFKNQTPGMTGYNLTLVSLDGTTKPIFIQLILRYIFTPLSILSIAGVVMAKYRKDKLTLHDLISGTKPIYNN